MCEHCVKEEFPNRVNLDFSFVTLLNNDFLLFWLGKNVFRFRNIYGQFEIVCQLPRKSVDNNEQVGRRGMWRWLASRDNFLPTWDYLIIYNILKRLSIINHHSTYCQTFVVLVNTRFPRTVTDSGLTETIKNTKWNVCCAGRQKIPSAYFPTIPAKCPASIFKQNFLSPGKMPCIITIFNNLSYKSIKRIHKNLTSK